MLIIEKAPHSIENAYNRVCTPDALAFLTEIVDHFDDKFEQLMRQTPETLNKHHIESSPSAVTLPCCFSISPGVHIGNCSPANKIQFIDALYAEARALHIDFADGHCPTWRNTVQGMDHVKSAIDGTLQGIPNDGSSLPDFIFMLRPNNMIEHHCMINGKEVLGSLFDFGMVMYHNANILYSNQRGPYLGVTKISSPAELQLWTELIAWTESRLQLPPNTVKLYITIDNIHAAMNIKSILNASDGYVIATSMNTNNIRANFITNYETVPDPLQMGNCLMNLMENLINTCRRHKVLVWKDVNNKMLTPGKGNCRKSMDIVETVQAEFHQSLSIGFDNYVVNDLRLVPHLNQVCANRPFMEIPIKLTLVCLYDDWDVPTLRHMIAITVLFIYHWLTGVGVFYYHQTAINASIVEVCRSQLWLYARKSWPIRTAKAEAATASSMVESLLVTRTVIYQHLNEIVSELKRIKLCVTPADQKRLLSAKFIFLDVISSRNSIDYITTYLNDIHKFRTLHNKSDGLQSML